MRAGHQPSAQVRDRRNGSRVALADQPRGRISMTHLSKAWLVVLSLPLACSDPGSTAPSATSTSPAKLSGSVSVGPPPSASTAPAAAAAAGPFKVVLEGKEHAPPIAFIRYRST